MVMEVEVVEVGDVVAAAPHAVDRDEDEVVVAVARIRPPRCLGPQLYPRNKRHPEDLLEP